VFFHREEVNAMKFEKQQESTFVNADFVESRRITEVVFTKDVVSEESKYGRGRQYNVEVEFSGKVAEDPSTLRLVPKSINTLIDRIGDESKDWLGRKIPICIEGEGQFKHVVVDAVKLQR